MRLLGPWGWLRLLLVCLLGCGSSELTAIPGTTTRVGRPQAEEGTELALRIFTTEDECAGARIDPAEQSLCLPHVDRSSGEVRVAYQFLLNEMVYDMPWFKEHLEVFHQGRKVLDGELGMDYEVIPHDPIPSRQLFILVIDGSSSMSKKNRLAKVKDALVRPDVMDAFYPQEVKTAVVLLQFTGGKPIPVGGEIKLLESRKAYKKAVDQLRVLSGYTHLYDAVAYASDELIQHPAIESVIEADDYTPTVVALTDGFNNVSAGDRCRDNAARLSTLLQLLLDIREGRGTDLRKRPTLFTVGLGRPLRPLFELPEGQGTEVRPVDLCGRKNRDRKIDGDLEEQGIDNASLTWIADRGGGLAYVRNDRKGLAAAFRAAAAKRYAWFELRYRVDPFYLRRSFRTRLRLVSYATAESSVVIHPSAWLDAPPGMRRDDGWADDPSYTHTLTVILPMLGLLLGFGYLGASLFNTRRALFGRTRRPPARRKGGGSGQVSPPAGTPPGTLPPGEGLP